MVEVIAIGVIVETTAAIEIVASVDTITTRTKTSDGAQTTTGTLQTTTITEPIHGAVVVAMETTIVAQLQHM